MITKKAAEQDTDSDHWLNEESKIIPQLIDTEITLGTTRGSCRRSEILEPNKIQPKSNISSKD